MKSDQLNSSRNLLHSSPMLASAPTSAGAHHSPDREYFDDVAAADYLKTSPRKLKDLRISGGGPRFVRLGQSPRYRRDWCDVWAEQNSVASTSEETGRRRT